MPFTNFPNGLTSFGVPVLGGIGGIPFTGNYFFVDPDTGNDGNDGESPDRAKDTLDSAFDRCLDGNNDVVVLMGDGTTAGTARLSATLEWDKDATHLVGVTAPTYVSQRARISNLSGADFTPMVQVTGDGCMFANVSTFHGGLAAAGVCWLDEGERNHYGNIHFGGMGTQAAADDAASRSLVIGAAGTGRGEHTFEHCTIGLDTVDRGAANASLELLGQSPRNVFRHCLFPMRSDAATPFFLEVGALGMDRFAWFQDCFFNNFGTTLTEGFNVDPSPGGNILYQRSSMIGATAIKATPGLVFVDGGPPTAATSGIAVATT